MVSTKNFLELAEILKKHRASEDLILDICSWLIKLNPRFSVSKFIDDMNPKQAQDKAA